MIDLTKHLEFFNPVSVTEPIHIIGLGAIGSHVAEQLARLGINKMYLYDFDTVDAHNLANQNYFANQIGMLKTVATEINIKTINPDAEIVTFDKGYIAQPLAGYIFLCVDSIELRNKITTAQLFNHNVTAILDFRMGLSDAQHYAATQANLKELLKTMDFTDNEAKEATPVSACGTTLSVIPTVKTIVSIGIANFINHTKEQPLKSMVLIDAFKPDILVM